jgi:hypothetical protein
VEPITRQSLAFQPSTFYMNFATNRTFGRIRSVALKKLNNDSEKRNFR